MNLIGYPPGAGGSKALVNQSGQNDLICGVGEQTGELGMAGFLPRGLQLIGSILPSGGQPRGLFKKIIVWFRGICHIIVECSPADQNYLNNSNFVLQT